MPLVMSTTELESLLVCILRIGDHNFCVGTGEVSPREKVERGQKIEPLMALRVQQRGLEFLPC